MGKDDLEILEAFRNLSPQMWEQMERLEAEQLEVDLGALADFEADMERYERDYPYTMYFLRTRGYSQTEIHEMMSSGSDEGRARMEQLFQEYLNSRGEYVV